LLPGMDSWNIFSLKKNETLQCWGNTATRTVSLVG
jgi:hypothetical protein